MSLITCAVKTMTTATQLNRGQAGGLALVRKHGHHHMSEIGRLGGRPRALMIGDIPPAAAANRRNGKEQRHGKSLGELRRLWRERQAASDKTGGLDAACLHNDERSSLEDSQHPGVRGQDLPKNNFSSIDSPSDPSTIHIPHFPCSTTTPSPREGGEG
jgi:hypothetical protein